MALRCRKCGSPVPEPVGHGVVKCPGCGVELSNEEQWHAYLTFFSIFVLVMVGTPLSLWTIQLVRSLLAHPGMAFTIPHAWSVVIIGGFTVAVLAILVAMMRFERQAGKRRSGEQPDGNR